MRLSIARLFLRKSPAIVSELDEDGNSAIHLAASRGHQNIADLLLRYGAAVDSRNNLRWTPLDCAAANGHRDCAQFLLENDSPVDPRDVSNVRFWISAIMELSCTNDNKEAIAEKSVIENYFHYCSRFERDCQGPRPVRW